MASAASGELTKHGIPRGYLEIIEILASRLRGGSLALPPPISRIFHDIYILDYHPQELYEEYKEYQEAGCIYFFSPQEFLPSDARAPGVDGRKRRPQRAAYRGGWKLSGAGKEIKRPLAKGGAVIGKVVTMVFYGRRRVGGVEKQFRTDWGMDEITLRVRPTKFSTLAVYRLFKVKTSAANGGHQQQANGAHHHHVPIAVADHHHVPAAAIIAVAEHHDIPPHRRLRHRQVMRLGLPPRYQPHKSRINSSASSKSSTTTPVRGNAGAEEYRGTPPPAAANPPVQQDDTNPVSHISEIN